MVGVTGMLITSGSIWNGQEEWREYLQIVFQPNRVILGNGIERF